MMPGFGELMRMESLKYVPTAILSRQTAGIRNKTLIVNLPGKPKSIRQCLDAVFPAIPYCIELLEGPRIECNPEVIKAFRPVVG
jgi:molybdopterin adenylyltransferase